MDKYTFAIQVFCVILIGISVGGIILLIRKG